MNRHPVHKTNTLLTSVEQEKQRKRPSPTDPTPSGQEPDADGYVYVADSKEDVRVFGDIMAIIGNKVATSPAEQEVGEEDLNEPPLRLRARARKLRQLTLPNLEDLIQVHFEEEEVKTIIPYELLPTEELDEVDEDEQSQANEYVPKKIGLQHIGNPTDVVGKLTRVGYQCDPFTALQVSLILTYPSSMVRALLLEGPPGAGKTFLAKSLAKVTGAELHYVSCYPGIEPGRLLEAPSNIAMAQIMAGGKGKDGDPINLGPVSVAFLASHEKPVILLIDEIDKAEEHIDTFFLGPISEARVNLESREPIFANLENLLIIFTKNFNRVIDDALMRRVTPLHMTYLENTLEKKILKPHILPQIAANLVYITDAMREADGFYKFERSPAPDELLRAGRYVLQMLEWGIVDFEVIGRSLWPILAKSERDRVTFEQLLRFHPEFADALITDPRKATRGQIHAKLGRIILKGVAEDPDAKKRQIAFQVDKVGWQHAGSPDQIVEKLGRVGYECPSYLSRQLGLILNVKREMVRALLLEGPPGAGKSYLAKCLARIAGAELMVMQCYKGMNTQHLIEHRNEVAIAKANAGVRIREDDIIELGILSKAFLKSQSQPVLLLIDEIDKVDPHIDTFFLGPIQDGRIWLLSGPALDCNLDNLFMVFTKNYERTLNDALMRRVHPLTMTYLDSKLERKILSAYCVPRLIDNLSYVADLMRYSKASYQFDRPPAPEELLTAARYILKLLEWGYDDRAEIGFNVWRMIAKSERDRLVLEHMMRYHPEFSEITIDPASLPMDQVYRRLGKVLLRGIIREDDEPADEHQYN